MNSSTGFAIIALISIATYIAGFYYSKKKGSHLLGSSLFTVSAVTGPTFAFATLWVLGLSSFADFAIRGVLASAILLVAFGVALWKTKKPILHAILGVFFTWFFYSILLESIKGTGYSFSLIKDIFAYLSMILGIGFFLYGNKISAKAENSTIVSVFVFAAFSIFLVAAYFLGGIWDLLYVAILFGVTKLAIKIKDGYALIPVVLAATFYILKLALYYFGAYLTILSLAGLTLLLLILLSLLARKIYTKSIKNLKN